MGMKMTVDDLIRKYELRIQKIEAAMPERERWGHGPHDKHEMALCQEFVAELKRLDQEPDDLKSSALWKKVQEHIGEAREHMNKLWEEVSK